MHTPSVVVILSERSESKDLRTDLTANVAVSVKILRLRASPSAQDDTLQRHSGNLQISIYRIQNDTGQTVMRGEFLARWCEILSSRCRLRLTDA